jgi:hypothetical protein
MPRVCGSFETTYSTDHVMYRLECAYVTINFNPFTRIASSESVRMCFEKLRIHFLESKDGAEETSFP